MLVLWSKNIQKPNNNKYNYNLEKYKHYFNNNKGTTDDTSIKKNDIDLKPDIKDTINNKSILEMINILIINLKNDNKIFDSFNSLELLKKQDIISTYLCKYVLQNNYLNIEFFISTVNLLKTISEKLRKKIKQKKISHDLNKIKITNNIPRSSYKFCNFKDACIYNYDSKKNGCYADHYVHNMVAADCEALIEYVNHNHKNKNIASHNKEIIKCINTLCFVIKHMYAELNSICLYSNPEDSDKLHQNRVIIKKSKKKNKNKNINI